MAGKYEIMREEERLQASALGFGDFFKGLGGSLRKKRLYAAIDQGRKGLRSLKVDQDDGEAVATIAGAYAKTLGVVTYFREKKKVDSLGTSAEIRQFIEVFGRYAAQGYFKAKQVAVSHEPSLLAIAVSRDDLTALLEEVVEAGHAVARSPDADDAPDELSIDEAVDLLASKLSEYETAIPQVEEDGSIPPSIQDRGIARAAFIAMRADELKEAAKKTMDVEEGVTRMILAERLADEYAGREEEIAQIVLKLDGNDAANIVTRLMPLAEAPNDLEEMAQRLAHLRDRYYETGPAQWFCFRDARYAHGTLTLRGQLLGYRVSASLVKDEARLQPARQRETVTVRLREGIDWAETSTRRAGNLSAIRRVLRRTELAQPRGALAAPSPVTGEPFQRCDSRTLWMLELLARELSQDPFTVEDHVMVSFERPRAEIPQKSANGRRSRVTAVRLKGELLIDHPEVCDLILGSRRLVDTELAMRFRVAGVDPRFYPQMRVRLSWANDHLAVTTYPSDHQYDARTHIRLVDAVRAAGSREIDPAYIHEPMQTVIANSALAETDDLGTVLGRTPGELRTA